MDVRVYEIGVEPAGSIGKVPMFRARLYVTATASVPDHLTDGALATSAESAVRNLASNVFFHHAYEVGSGALPVATACRVVVRP